MLDLFEITPKYITTAAVLGVGLALNTAHAQIIDDFSVGIMPTLVVDTNNGDPVGTSRMSTQTGAATQIIGTERDVSITLTQGPGSVQAFVNTATNMFDYAETASAGGSAVITWDGVGSPGSGLGSIVSAGGDTFELQVAINEPNPTNVTVTVNGVSSTVVVPPNSPGSYQIPFTRFAGVDFTNVSAIQLSIDNDNLPQQDMTLALFQIVDLVQPTLTATKTSTVDAGADNCFGAGDTLSYSVTVTNNGPDFAVGTVLTDTPDANTTLVAGSVTSSTGTVTSGNTNGDTTVAVNLGTLAPGASATVTFDATVNNGVAGGTALSNQASVTAVGNVSAQSNTTQNTLDNCAAALTITKTSPNGQFCPGDAIAYSITVTNNGTLDATAVNITDTLDANTSVMANSATTTAGAVTSAAGGSVVVDIPTLAAGASATVSFQATVAAGVADLTPITNSATVTATGIAAVSATASDSVDDCVPAAVPTLSEWAMILLALSLGVMGWVYSRRGYTF